MYTWDEQLIKSLIIAIYTLLLFYIIVFDVFDCVVVFTHSYTTVSYTNCLLFAALLSVRLPNLTLRPDSYEYNRVFWRSR